MLFGMYTIPLCSFHGESQLSGLIKHCNIETLCKETSVSKQLPRLREKEEEFLDKHSEVGTVGSTARTEPSLRGTVSWWTDGYAGAAWTTKGADFIVLTWESLPRLFVQSCAGIWSHPLSPGMEKHTHHTSVSKEDGREKTGEWHVCLLACFREKGQRILQTHA